MAFKENMRKTLSESPKDADNPGKIFILMWEDISNESDWTQSGTNGSNPCPSLIPRPVYGPLVYENTA